MQRETTRVLYDSLREYPAMHARVALMYTLRTLVRFGTGEGLGSEAAPWIEEQLSKYAPGDLGSYRAAKQQAGQIPVSRLRSLHTPFGFVLLAASVLVVGLNRALKLASVRFLAFVLAALLLNALLSGNLAGVYDRYQSRLVWLLAVGLWGHFGERERERGSRILRSNNVTTT